MTTTDTQVPARPGRRRPDGDFASLFPELYRSAFTAAHSELRSRAAAEEVTYATLARAHARWSRIGDAPVFWVSTSARTHALDMLQRQPPGREVLLDDEAELLPGEIPDPAPGDLASITRRGTWLRRRRRAGWLAAGISAGAAALLVIGLANSLPPPQRGPASVPTTSAAPRPADQRLTAEPDRSPIGSAPWTSPELSYGLISAGRSERGSVRLDFRAASAFGFTQADDPEVTGWTAGQQLIIDPHAWLRTSSKAGVLTPEELVRTLNRDTPGGHAYAWVRRGPDGRITALLQE
jgi:DNA-directed RNA polymerase specialized sigma24 family protein